MFGRWLAFAGLVAVVFSVSAHFFLSPAHAARTRPHTPAQPSAPPTLPDRGRTSARRRSPPSLPPSFCACVCARARAGPGAGRVLACTQCGPAPCAPPRPPAAPSPSPPVFRANGVTHTGFMNCTCIPSDRSSRMVLICVFQFRAKNGSCLVLTLLHSSYVSVCGENCAILKISECVARAAPGAPPGRQAVFHCF